MPFDARRSTCVEVRLRWLPDAEALRETVPRLVEARRESKQGRTFETGEEGLAH